MRLLSLLCSLLFACGGGSPSPGPGVEYALTVTVPPGGEVFRCQFVELPPGALVITGGAHHYTPGSHHFLVFRTDLDRIPAGQEGAADCYESGADYMRYVRGVIYGAQEPTGSLTLPTDVGLQARHRVLLLQAHYLNTGSQPLSAEVRVRLETAPASAVSQRAGVLFFYDPFIHVPAGDSAMASMRCPIRHEITLLNAVSHFHRRGVGYRAFVDSPPETLSSTPFYTSSTWDDPDPRREPLTVPAGAGIRFECDYENGTGTRAYYQGQSAEDNEMCMFTALYYPALEEADELCLSGADWFGTGSQTCAEGLSCVQGCPLEGAPRPGTGQVGECWQRCFTATCPSASAPLIRQLSCIRQHCAVACAGGGSACTSCVTSNCATEAAACLSHACPG